MKHKHCPAQLHARHLRGHVRARAKVVGAAAGRRGSLHILACRRLRVVGTQCVHIFIFIFMLFFPSPLSAVSHCTSPHPGGGVRTHRPLTLSAVAQNVVRHVLERPAAGQIVGLLLVLIFDPLLFLNCSFV